MYCLTLTMNQKNKETGKGIVIGALLAAALWKVLKIIDRHLQKKQ